jgi:D-psicose/D-tagatose/L-ribulose 3-epimerase
MNPLGVHALVFVSGWRQEEVAKAVRLAAECGYRYLEIPLIDPKAIDVRRTLRELEVAGVEPVTSLGLGFETDISSGDPGRVSRGETLLREALAVARDLGAKMLSGVLYSALAKYREAPTPEGRWNCIQVLRRLAERARDSAMTIGLEPVNRYESNLVNSGEQALALIDEIGADNMVVHLDSYHMNIEEGAPGPLITRLGNRLGYVHVNESHRGYLGTGSIDFDRLFDALVQVDYKGIVTFEAFSAGVGDPALNAELAVWRSLFDDPVALAADARTFMARKLEEARARQAVKQRLEQRGRERANEAAMPPPATLATPPPAAKRPLSDKAEKAPSSTAATAKPRAFGWSPKR